MKKLFNAIVICLVLALSVSVFAACDDGTTAGGSAKGSSDIEISDPEFGFIKEEDYDPESFDFDTSQKWTNLDVDAEYYLFIEFSVTSRRNNDGQSLLNVDFTFDALDIMQGTMEDVSTGLIEEMTFNDASTGRPGKTTTISFKIPDKSSKPKTINMIVRLKPMQKGESHIIIGYRYDAPDQYKLLGSDGYTKNLKIQSVQIVTPELSVTEMGALTWKNVKNADYYCIFEAGSSTPLTDWNDEVIYIRTEGTSVGGTMIFNVGEFLIGYHALVIRAYSNNKNIEPSNYSDPVEHEW